MGSHALLFMVPLGPPGVRPMAQALRLPFEYYITDTSNIACKDVLCDVNKTLLGNCK